MVSDEKLTALRQSHTLHPHPEKVHDPLFVQGLPFFDARDFVQVKYELLRRVRVDGQPVAQAVDQFGVSRPTFYAAQAAWESAGLAGLLPHTTGPRQGHKLTPAILAELIPHATTLSSTQLAQLVQERFHVAIHPRSIERALVREAKKGGAQP